MLEPASLLDTVTVTPTRSEQRLVYPVAQAYPQDLRLPHGAFEPRTVEIVPQPKPAPYRIVQQLPSPTPMPDPRRLIVR